jgi:hypothetical protein
MTSDQIPASSVRELVEQAYNDAIHAQLSDTEAQAAGFRVLRDLAMAGDPRVLDTHEQQLKAAFIERFGGAGLVAQEQQAEGDEE